MPETAPLLAFLGHVRRRYIATELIRNGVTALVFGLSGFVFLLLLGTQIFDWYWPALLFAGAFAFGAWKFRKRLPNRYRMAQIVDRRLALHDSLSTALYFLPAAGPMVEAQRIQAGQLASGLSAQTAVPMVWPRTTYAAIALFLSAFTLVGIRYGLLDSLDLKAPVSETVADVFRYVIPGAKKQYASNRGPQLPDEMQQLSMSIDEAAKDELNKIEMAKEGEITTSDIPDVNDLSDTARGEKGKAGTEGKGVNPGETDGGGEGNQESQNADPNDSDKQQPQPDGKQQNAKNAKEGTKSGENNLQSNQNSSMLDKMKDAFSNMMNKLKTPNANEQQQAANQKGEGKGGQQKGGQQPGKQPGKGKDAQGGAEQPGDEAGEAAEKMANAQGQAGDKSASMQAPPDAKSGVGKADGDKSIKEAEQLQAMGKISEILGKRAKDISGEVMVEVNGGRQQLRTQYSNTNARHTESGGEIHRDEVPLHHQHYIQQYFEQVRKQSNAPAKTK